MRIFKDRRTYIAGCKECGWTENLPPHASVNDICPRCHAELVQLRGNIATFYDERPVMRGQIHVGVMS